MLCLAEHRADFYRWISELEKIEAKSKGRRFMDM